ITSWIQRLKVEKPIPKSAATSLRAPMFVNAARIGSARSAHTGPWPIWTCRCDAALALRPIVHCTEYE
ncbi:MAG: hypothetical protein WBH04_10725, partial [Albidovulum sp.]